MIIGYTNIIMKKIHEIINKIGYDYSRILYDILVLIFASFIAFLVDYSYFSKNNFFISFFPTLLLLFFNFLFGIYTKLKYSFFLKKILYLSFFFLITFFFTIFIFSQTLNSFIWFISSYPAIILSRFFIGINQTKSFNFIKKIINTKGPILIIGGGGYIGSNLVNILLNNNVSVKVLDKFNYGLDPVKQFLKNKNFELIQADSTNLNALVRAMTGVSSVVHLAGIVGDPACSINEEYTRHTNIVTTRIAKDVAMSLGVSRFIFTSSCSVYGFNNSIVNEKSSLNPLSLYAQTKIDSENELLNSITENFSVTILRLSTVFGHSLRPRFDLVGNLFVAQGMTDKIINVIGPNQIRPLIHVSDVSKAIMKTLSADIKKIKGEIFNVGDDNMNFTILELAQKAKKIIDKYCNEISININSSKLLDLRNYNVSFKKIKEILDFDNSISIEEGLEEIVKKFLNNYYKNYKDPSYNNFLLAQKELENFNDPEQNIGLYKPL